jgi:hypothetical protein
VTNSGFRCLTEASEIDSFELLVYLDAARTVCSAARALRWQPETQTRARTGTAELARFDGEADATKKVVLFH